MGTLTKGYTFGATEEVTATKLHSLVDSGSISGIVAADITNSTITDAKISSVAGNKFITLTGIPAGAGIIPKENLTSVAQKGANSDITSLTGLTTPLSTAQGGTGSSAAKNVANGVVVLDASGKLPDITGVISTSKVYDSGWFAVTASTSYTKTHSLGTTKVITSVYFSDTSDGSGVVCMVNGGMDVDQDGRSTYFPNVTALSTTDITVHTGGGYFNKVAYPANESWYNSGYYRIVMLALE